MSNFVPGCFDTSGSMIPLSVHTYICDLTYVSRRKYDEDGVPEKLLLLFLLKDKTADIKFWTPIVTLCWIWIRHKTAEHSFRYGMNTSNIALMFGICNVCKLWKYERWPFAGVSIQLIQIVQRLKDRRDLSKYPFDFVWTI